MRSGGTCGPNDVYAVGWWGILRRYDGKTWSPQVSGANVELTGVWGSGPKDLHLVGHVGTILHNDGKG